jgi:hypothetical protein
MCSSQRARWCVLPASLDGCCVLPCISTYFNITLLLLPLPLPLPLLQGVGTCEQNPASVHMSSSPNLDVRCKITVLKVLLVLAASQLTSQHKWQSVACMLISGWAFWMNFRQVGQGLNAASLLLQYHMAYTES